MKGFSTQTVNGVGSGSAYQAALLQEVVRRVVPGDRLDAELDKLMRDRQYSEDEYDYFIDPETYLDNRLNRKAILHRLALWGFEGAEHIYDDERFAEVVKGYPISADPQGGDEWVTLILSNPSQAERCPWALLDGWNWAELLAEQPAFARFCDWTKLDSVAWTYLLAATDQFDDKCDFSQFDGVAWVYLVKQRRELARFLNRKELNDRDGSRVDWILRSS